MINMRQADRHPAEVPGDSRRAELSTSQRVFSSILSSTQGPNSACHQPVMYHSRQCYLVCTVSFKVVNPTGGVQKFLSWTCRVLHVTSGLARPVPLSIPHRADLLHTLHGILTDSSEPHGYCTLRSGLLFALIHQIICPPTPSRSQRLTTPWQPQ